MRVALSLCLLATPAAARPLLLDRPDLHAHFWVSYGLSLTLTEVLEGPEPTWGPALGTGPALAIATGAVAAIGIGKELLDDHVDAGDLTADALGLLTQAVLQLTVSF
ncbi:MAG: hypothetical protein R3F60_25615 [bacterium]